jgi:hypothetical protein
MLTTPFGTEIKGLALQGKLPSAIHYANPMPFTNDTEMWRFFRHHAFNAAYSFDAKRFLGSFELSGF